LSFIEILICPYKWYDLYFHFYNSFKNQKDGRYKMKNKSNWSLQSRFVHSGSGIDFSKVRTPNPPIFQSSVYLYDDVESGTDILVGKQPGHIYSRYTNPTVDALNQVLAEIEGGEAALSFSSGLAAISAAIFAFCKPGDHIVSSSLIYGGTYHLLQEHMSRLGIKTTFVDPRNLDELEKSISPATRILYAEPLSNPTLVSVDIFKWAALADKYQSKLLVDNTFTPPPIFRALDAGADVVIHSATKYLGGHSDLVGGALIGSDDDIEKIRPYLKYHGGIISPMIAWLVLRGIRTLGIRLERQCDNALRIAHYLENHPKIERVHYAGLPSNDHYQFNKQHFKGFSGMLSFEVKGGFEVAKKMMQQLSLIQFTVSLGDVATLISHPASASHVYLAPEERLAVGVTDGLLRLSVGIESGDDLIEDLENALSE
jgi:methionine-gamma-lyase